jgi:CheY-like chemotaxis protein
MPKMNGAETLRRIRELQPDTVRMLLTGYADLDSAISAVNEANIFRFLTKPATPAVVNNAITDAVRQHHLITAERELLEDTLRGSVRALIDTLALASPTAFARASRLKETVGRILDHLSPENRWEVEVAAMLSHIGTITLPESVIVKMHTGVLLDADEQEMVQRLPFVACDLLSDIARLGGVRHIIAAQVHAVSTTDPLGTRVIAAASAFESHLCSGRTPAQAVAEIELQHAVYGKEITTAVAAGLVNGAGNMRRIAVRLNELRTGMILADDICTSDGTLLVAHGFEVTAGLLERIRNYLHKNALGADTIHAYEKVSAQ